MSDLNKPKSDVLLTQLNRKERQRRKLDTLLVITISALMIVAGGYFDWFESWYQFIHEHEEWELDELVVGVFSLSILMLWYVWRRQTHANSIKKIAENLQKEALKANNAKSEFLTSMSHDLRTPLNAIMGFSEIMQMELYGPLGDDRYNQYINDIHESGALLISLINDVLDLSKIEAGKYILAKDTIDIFELAHSSRRQLQSMANSNNLTIEIQTSDNMPKMLGDERALIQIFNNLLSNSIKFTPDDGNIVVTIKTDELDNITISVTDTGIGMDEIGIAKALMPFEQIDGKYAKKYDGSGLGMFICVKFMKLFGGTLELESQVDVGTTVTLRFPPERTINQTLNPSQDLTP